MTKGEESAYLEWYNNGHDRWDFLTRKERRAVSRDAWQQWVIMLLHNPDSKYRRYLDRALARVNTKRPVGVSTMEGERRVVKFRRGVQLATRDQQAKWIVATIGKSEFTYARVRFALRKDVCEAMASV